MLPHCKAATRMEAPGWGRVAAGHGRGAALKAGGIFKVDVNGGFPPRPEARVGRDEDPQEPSAEEPRWSYADGTKAFHGSEASLSCQRLPKTACEEGASCAGAGRQEMESGEFRGAGALQGSHSKDSLLPWITCDFI